MNLASSATTPRSCVPRNWPTRSPAHGSVTTTCSRSLASRAVRGIRQRGIAVNDQCTAVDSVGEEVTFDPTSATPNSTPHTIDSGRSLFGVACPSMTQCTAVDTNGGEVTFDPTSPTPNSTPHTIDSGRSLFGVACPSATQCTAVGGLREVRLAIQSPPLLAEVRQRLLAGVELRQLAGALLAHEHRPCAQLARRSRRGPPVVREQPPEAAAGRGHRADYGQRRLDANGAARNPLVEVRARDPQTRAQARRPQVAARDRAVDRSGGEAGQLCGLGGTKEHGVLLSVHVIPREHRGTSARIGPHFIAGSLQERQSRVVPLWYL